jgi:putative zinc finger/helix-turn-helix YgiT family protein
MKRCVQCKHVGLENQQADDQIMVGERTFTATLPAQVCPICGETYIGFEDLGRFEHAVASTLAREGTSSPEAFRFMRKSLGIPAVELAELLDVTPETVSRWEHGKLRVERRSLALLGSLVLEHAEGRTSMLDHLRSLKEPRNPGSDHQRLELASHRG